MVALMVVMAKSPGAVDAHSDSEEAWGKAVTTAAKPRVTKDFIFESLVEATELSIGRT